MVAKKLLSQADLVRIQAFRIHELSKLIMVNENKHLVFATF